MTSTIAHIAAAHAAVDALHAMPAESPGWSAENDRVRAVVEAAYTLPTITAAEKAAMAALVIAFEGDAIEPAIVLALRSIAA